MPLQERRLGISASLPKSEKKLVKHNIPPPPPPQGVGGGGGDSIVPFSEQSRAIANGTDVSHVPDAITFSIATLYPWAV